MSIQQLREERNRLAGKARQILDENKENWTDELGEEVDALYAQIDKIDAQIAREQNQLNLEARLQIDATNPDTPATPDGTTGNVSARSEAHGLIFDAYLRGMKTP